MKWEKYMKKIKKSLLCLLVVSMFLNSQAIYVNAAASIDTYNSVMTTEYSIINQDSTKDGVTVRFSFGYSDGTDVVLIAVVCLDRNYSMPNPPSSYFSGDTRYATAVVKHKTTGVEITIRAWCDFYGDSGTF